jgi:flagellar hook-associated protein 1 FlgK
LGVAGDGLAAQTAGLNVTGQNVANANTPGYSRLSVNLETLQLGDSYGGSVRAANVLRSSDQFAYARVLEEQSKGGAADARSTALAQVEAIVAPSGGTIADRANAFFSSMSTLSSSPSDPSARAAVLGSAASLAQSISSTAAGLASAKGSLLTTAQGVATQVNSELAQIAQLNGQIAQARAAGDPAASLSDQRDRLVSSVGTEIGAKTVEEPSGITLFAGGTALVVGNTAASIHVGLDAASNLKIVANRGGGDPALDITSNTNDGTLGGIREARDQDIPAVASQLDQFASDLATSVNSIHSAGFGLDGVGGRNLFAQPATVSGAAYAFSIDPTLVGHPERIAAAKSAADVPGGNDVALQLAQLASAALRQVSGRRSPQPTPRASCAKIP